MVCSSSNLHVTHFICEQSHERETLKWILHGFSLAAPFTLTSLTTLGEAHPAVPLAVFLWSHKELQTHCLLHPSRPPGPPSCLSSVPWEGRELVRKAACSGVVAISKGQLPSLILQGDETLQCSMSHWDKVAALPLVSVCHIFLALSKELSRHESRACFAVLHADWIWTPSVCPGTRSTPGTALSFSNRISQGAASYCNP